MKIQKYGIVLDGDGRNVLEKEFSKDYSNIDSLDSPEKIVKVMEDVFRLSDRAEEYMYLICMTAGCNPIGFFEVSHGTCRATVAVHNHPGGRIQPSGEDFRVTGRIQEAADLLGIIFCDHIIISRDSYFSFSENGKMQK